MKSLVIERPEVADFSASNGRLLDIVHTEPRFRTTTRRGELVASFPLGTHPDPETTEWHPIIAFGERARRLQETPLAKGQLVEVVGYVHERIGRTRSGETKVTKQIYATAIRTTLTKPPTGS